jgi:hypothetical protein
MTANFNAAMGWYAVDSVVYPHTPQRTGDCTQGLMESGRLYSFWRLICHCPASAYEKSFCIVVQHSLTHNTFL